ncbi:MAG TPA: PQQ-binding-like beta-propeller repeat protein [Chitinophagaceae bacterium]|nr:PQQ-binding-like beta-propeller repeat protein [Chitinophagaceae bacterium]
MEITRLIVSNRLRLLLLVVLAGSIGCNTPETGDESIFKKTIALNTPSTGWVEYNGDGSRSHYSTLTQVSKENVTNLKVAWTYSSVGRDSVLKGTQMQCNPVIIDGILYGVSAKTQVFALDAATGKELWKTAIADNAGTTSRGVTYFTDGVTRRLFFGAGKWLYAINAETGALINTFGAAGKIDLKKGITRPGADNYVRANTPNTIYKDLIIVGTRVAEEDRALLGDIRAYNVYTGKLVWTFKTIPEPGQPGYETWSPPEPRKRIGGANSWAGMAIDRERGIVYAPTGSAAYDFYGGNRKGDNLYANCLLALNAATGKLLWHFQFVHHDIWDRDPPSPPNLLTVINKGVKVDAVAQVTKQGFVFLFDRVSGKPLFDIAERKVRTDAIAGEAPSPTQPFPTKPEPFTKQSFTEGDFNPFVADKDSLVKLLKASRHGSSYIPVGRDMTLFFPGTDGGAQWGGAATDNDGILYVPAKQLPVYTSLVDVKKNAADIPLTGHDLYINNCASCHGEDRRGNHDGSYPSISNVNKKYKAEELKMIIEKGRGMMPSFSHLSIQERNAIVNLVMDKQNAGLQKILVKAKNKDNSPYQHTGYNRWYDRNGYPVSSPPWGTLTAIDLNTGIKKWQVPLGEYEELTKKGIPVTGTDNYGGPLVTASGLIFIASSRDEKFRAFDKETGKLLWEAKLPAAGYASPSTYSIKGKQYIVIACGGGKLKSKSGDQYVAFCLN